LPLRLGYRPYRADFVFRMLHVAQSWGMTEVLILGLLVALVKLAHIASVVPDTALWSCGALMLLLAAAVILTSSVVTRYFLHASTDWQDEASEFCLVGATFLCSAFVQAIRGHVGIEAVSTLLPDGVNRVRIAIVDTGCLAFCVFFAWKSCTLLHEAWSEGQTTSSSWAPPLWIPYSLMSAGMILLSVQLAVQVVVSANKVGGR